jgi:hypothetical protein
MIRGRGKADDTGKPTSTAKRLRPAHPLIHPLGVVTDTVYQASPHTTSSGWGNQDPTGSGLSPLPPKGEGVRRDLTGSNSCPLPSYAGPRISFGETLTKAARSKAAIAFDGLYQCRDTDCTWCSRSVACRVVSVRRSIVSNMRMNVRK